MVVHPRHGVATVQAVATRGAGRDRRTFLELVFSANSLKILVPMDSVDEVGLRGLPTAREAAAVLAVLTGPSDVSAAWSERSASSSSRVQSGEIAQAAMVIRDLTRHARRSGKPLSSSEKGVLDGCLERVSSELSLVLGISQDDARTLLLEKAHSQE